MGVFPTGVLCPLFVVVFGSSVLAAEPIRLEQPFVTVGDVVQTSMPETSALSEMLSLPLFRLKAGVEQSFSHETLRSSLVRRVPGLKGQLNTVNAEPQTFIYIEPVDESVSECLRLNKTVSEGDTILRRDAFLSLNCGSADQSLLLYNKSVEAYEATQTLPAGSQIPIFSAVILPVAAKGEELTLESQVGPVTIRRPVTLTEPVFASGLTHVRTSDGVVVAADLVLTGE